MASKKVYSIEDAVNDFKSVMQRASLFDYIQVNGVLVSKTPKNKTIVITPDTLLWSKLIEDPELKEHIKEPDPNQEFDNRLIQFGSDLQNTGWLELDAATLFAGQIIKIDVEGRKYQLLLNKDLLPVKLKKSECNNIAYRIVYPEFLLLKKKFESKVEGGEFTMMRLFQIL